MRLLAISILTLAVTVPATAQEVSKHEAELAGQSVLDPWNQAAQQKDAAGLAALYTDDAVQVTEQGIISGRSAIERADADLFKVFTFGPSKIEYVVMLGNDVMLRGGSWSGTYSSPGGPVPLTGHWSDTDVRVGSTWKIRQETSNSVPPAPDK